MILKVGGTRMSSRQLTSHHQWTDDPLDEEQPKELGSKLLG